MSVAASIQPATEVPSVGQRSEHPSHVARRIVDGSPDSAIDAVGEDTGDLVEPAGVGLVVGEEGLACVRCGASGLEVVLDPGSPTSQFGLLGLDEEELGVGSAPTLPPRARPASQLLVSPIEQGELVHRAVTGTPERVAVVRAICGRAGQDVLETPLLTDQLGRRTGEQ